MAARKRRVGLVGFGSLGQYLLDKITHDPTASAALEIAFVWNRSTERVAQNASIPPHARCTDLAAFEAFGADLIVEVCHPDITKQWGAQFLGAADYYCGSPTAFADEDTARRLRGVAAAGHGLYVPAGALWGTQDLAKMSDRGGLTYLSVTMKKHPLSLKLEGALGERVQRLLDGGEPGEHVIFEGSVRALCPLAPNNVNTMAAAAIAASNLGFDGVLGRLVADASLQGHVVVVEARGAPQPDGQCFTCVTERYNPAPPGAVTGAATYASFLSSLLAAHGRGAGVHMC